MQYAISLVTQSQNIFLNTDKPWQETFRWLKKKCDKSASSFMALYFSDKEYVFIEQSNINKYLTYEEKKVFVNNLIANPSHHVEVLKYLAEEFIDTFFSS